MKYSLILFFLLVLFFACKPGNKEASADGSIDVKAYEDSLLAVHDVVMPRLTEIQKLSSDLRNVKAGIKENEQGKLEYPAGLDETLESLKLADQGMWDWMKNYHDGRDSVPKDQLMPYLQNQMGQIQSVKKQIEDSIAKAEAWLKQHGVKNEGKENVQ